VQTEQTSGRELTSWADIDWSLVEEHVRHLQGRIFRAAAAGKKQRVKSLQKLLVRSCFVKMLAIRQVTQQNKGKNTAGVDGVVCDTPQSRLRLLNEGLDLKGYQPKPVRRVFIPKSNGKRRPLGIPTVRDRVMQAIVKMALEPEWEHRFEVNSYGFRPGRRTMDAVSAIHHTIASRGSSEWVLDADISGCFDNIDHEAMLKRLPVFTTILRRWLKAGVVEFGTYRETEAGTPQGGIISPLLANVALDGLERIFGAYNAKDRYQRPAVRSSMDKGISLIRYADDFVVTAPSRERLEQYVLPAVDTFLKKRGLTLNQGKTRIVHVTDGFDFLGFTIRQYGEKTLTKPQKEKTLSHLRQIRDILVKNRTATSGNIVNLLNPIIRGWSNYYRYGSSTQTFSYADHRLWQMLWKWSCRRHRKKSCQWIRQRYFTRVGQREWVFFGEREETGKRIQLAYQSYAENWVTR
jgi:RNA-directed DNA polymerase